MTTTAEPRRVARAVPKAVRVAIYCRKSVEKGGPEALTSIDAQRSMVESYVHSQAGNGWRALPERFDDAGVSGATLARPAFRRLMEQVQQSAIDVIAVYRLDRVSRSMLDFLQLQARCEKLGVRFVSICERLDTTTAMGVFGIQLIMAVAQLERGQTAERVRDKTATAREHGLWTGGRPPLGLDSVNKRLVVNETEAAVVREIFALYSRLPTVADLCGEVAARGWRNKHWVNKLGKPAGGATFDKARLRALLANPLYAGLIRAGDELRTAQHKPIIDRATWDSVQTKLATKTPTARRKRQTWSALLGGLLHCGCGASMTHHFTSRHGRQFHYYVCSRKLRERAAVCTGSRVRMDELDACLVERLGALGRDRALAAATAAAARRTDPSLDESVLRRVLAELTPLWEVMQLRERQRVLHLLVERVTYTAATHVIDLKLRDSGVRILARGLSGEAAS